MNEVYEDIIWKEIEKMQNDNTISEEDNILAKAIMILKQKG